MPSSDEILLKNRISDLAELSYEKGIFTNTHFLSPLEQSIFLSMKNELPPVGFKLVGGSEGAIRKLIIFGDEAELGYSPEKIIRTIHVSPKAEKFAEELSHRDYLGSLMGLGIEREMTGDIIIREKEAWVFAIDSITPFIIDSLSQVRHTAVTCEEVDETDLSLEISYENLSANIASERIDLLIAALCSINRENAKKLLKDDRIFLNGRIVSSAGQKLKEGDELVIRGYGKFIFDGIDKVTRKGRINISARKYV